MDNDEKTTISDESPPEFEFGSLTPSSPSQDSFIENSPADHLFFNGRLLPHAFPTTRNNSKRSTSEYTSRSSSMNSRSSNISSTSHSPRSSSCNSNNSPIINQKPLDLKPPSGKTVNTTGRKSIEAVTSSLYRSYSSQRWQYITPAPVKRNGGIRVDGRKKKKAMRMKKKKKVRVRRVSIVMKWWRRILMTAIFACRECHALEGA